MQHQHRAGGAAVFERSRAGRDIDCQRGRRGRHRRASAVDGGHVNSVACGARRRCVADFDDCGSAAAD